MCITLLAHLGFFRTHKYLFAADGLENVDTKTLILENTDECFYAMMLLLDSLLVSNIIIKLEDHSIT
jgi:hypothetical protein